MKGGRAAIPEGVLLYAIGDIHGRADLLDALLGLIVEDAARFEAARRMLVFLGDYVDRGPDSAGVIGRLCGEAPGGFEAVCLKGNHEALMLDFLSRPEALELWLYNGGAETLASYGVSHGELLNRTDGPARCRDALAEAMPDRHRAFLSALELSAILGGYFFVHAGVRPGVALERQSEHDMMWIRHEFLNSEEDFGKVVVHGHTPAAAPEARANRIGIDTGAWQSGVLTALRLYGETRAFLATG